MSRSTYYTARARTPKNCWTCDGITACKCSKVELRAAKRAAKVRWGKEVANDYEEYIDEVVWVRTDRSGNLLPPHVRGDKRFWTSRLDYAYDEGYGNCGDWCPCGSNLENWMDWLRMQETYPPEHLPNPVLSKEDMAA